MEKHCNKNEQSAIALRDLSDDLENWMTNLPQTIKAAPIIYLTIPGSHDSFTAKITENSDVGPDAEDIIKALAHLGSIAKLVIANWSRTQTYMAADQLKRGIRYFDLRIATKENTEDLFIVHALYSENLQAIFDEISSFLESHPKEIVILDCQHFYGFEDSNHQKLIQMFTTSFGAKLLPYASDMQNITLDSIAQENYQVICIYRENTTNHQSFQWPSSSFPTPWPNTTDQTVLFDALDKGISERSSDIAYISQCVLTPDVDFILAHLLSTLQKECAENLEAARNEWINKQSPGQGKMNIIIADYIDLNDSQYVKNVINLNQQLMSRKL